MLTEMNSPEMNNLPMPLDEMGRIMALSDFDLDYSDLSNNFKDLTKLAAKVAGTDISLINLIDSYTQWSVSSYGINLTQMPREDSVCQYTIVQPEEFEVPDLSADDRFKDKFYVTGDAQLRYYYGVPLRAEGHHIGALCVLDTARHLLSPEKVELLKIIADEIVNRLGTLKVIDSLRSQVSDISENQRRVAHDIRGPLGGIIGLAQIISEQGSENTMEEVLEFINLIQQSGRSILELADEILSNEKVKLNQALNGVDSHAYNLLILKDTLIKLYAPQAINKKIRFNVTITTDTETIPFSKNKLLQIIGNLISNSMKFTPLGGQIAVDLTLKLGTPDNTLYIGVEDTGIGMDQQQIDKFLEGKSESTNGTGGEQGYGFGLALVKHLVDSLNGTITITSQANKGTVIEVRLPQALAN
jgi:signal transduction histidine kinase